MMSGGRTWGVWWVAATVSATASAAAAEPGAGSATGPAAESVTESAAGLTVLVAPLQGDESLRGAREGQVRDAVRRAVESHGYAIAPAALVLGHAVVACQSPECIARTLDAASAELAIVPAVWLQPSGGEELTLTLIRPNEKNLNASGPVGDDLSEAASRLLAELLAPRAAVIAKPAFEASSAEPTRRQPKYPHAWKAGPICLLAGGTAAFLAIGIGAATKSEQEQLDTTAVAIWSAVGVAALAGGITWWVIGAKRRRAPTVALRPTGIDLRLRF